MVERGGHAGRATLPDEDDGHAGRATLPDEDDGHAGLVTLPGTVVEAWQNLWGSTYKAVGKSLFSTKSGRKTLAYRTFADEIHVDENGQFHFFKGGLDGRAGRVTLPDGTSVDGQTGLSYFAGLSLKVTTAGAVTATLTYDTGKTKKDPKTKKPVKVYYKPTCAAVVIPASAPDASPFECHAWLYFAPSPSNAFLGCAGRIPILE